MLATEIYKAKQKISPEIVNSLFEFTNKNCKEFTNKNCN